MECANCRGTVPADARFCPSCGTPGPGAATGRPVAAAEERKWVTLVFCDMVGSTALSGRLDPETLRAVTLRYFDVMRREIEAHGGTVEKFIGDAVMAVFGVPVTHEDDARRACAAALAMVRALDDLNRGLEAALGVRLSIRIGVNTGEVVAAADASARQALVSGETVNVAARLEQNAAAGEILIGPDTRAAAGPAALTEPVGPLSLKGKTDAVTAYRLLDLGEDDPELMRRFDVPFIGRDRELAELDLAHHSVSLGDGSQLVTVYGEAGIGKTRLVREWLDRAGAGLAHGTGRCRPYGEHGSLAPLADAVRQLLGEAADAVTEDGGAGIGAVDSGIGADTLRTSAADALRTGGADSRTTGAADFRTGPDVTAPAGRVADRHGVTDPAEREELNAAMAVLSLGLLQDGTPHPSVDETCSALVSLLTVLSAVRPVALLIDDCHWAGELLLSVLDRLVEELDGSAVLFLCTARLDLLDRHPGWGAGRLRARSLTLSGLSTAEAEVMAAALTEVSAHRDLVLDDLLRRAEGNPLHLEQLLTALDEPVGVGELPATLQALLGARIGALDRGQRTALDVAAVLGREFTVAELDALIADDPLAEPPAAAAGPAPGDAFAPDPARAGRGARGALVQLSRRRLVSPLRRSAVGAAAFRFSSGLVQEVCYQSMAKRVRAERHERAAALPAVRAAGDAKAAAHLELAHRYRTELGLLDAHTEQVRGRAVDLLLSAGSGALARSDLSWAAELLAKVVELGRPGEAARTRAVRRLGEVELARGHADRGAALLREAAESTAGADDVEHAFAVLALAAAEGADLADLAAAARDLLPVFAAAGSDLGQARCRIRMAQDCQLQGRHGEADALLTLALADAVRADAEPERAQALGATAVSLWRGPVPVAAAVARCRSLLAEHGGPRPTVRVTLNCPLAVLLALDGAFDEARRCLATAQRLADELGYAEAGVALPLFAAEVETLAGRPEAVADLLDRAAEAAEAVGATALQGTTRRIRARALLDAGRPEEAWSRLGDDAVSAALPAADAADLYGLQARLAAHRGEPDAALALADRALDAAMRTDSPLLRAVAWDDRAAVHALFGRADAARADRAEATAARAVKGWAVRAAPTEEEAR